MKLSAIAMVILSITCSNIYAEQNMPTQSNSQFNQSPSIKNEMSGQAFLEANKKNPGVVTLADGLQYKILIKGNGAKPKQNDIVTVDYAGRLINGTEFDSSYKRGQPATFQVSGVIHGWTEALQLMPVGSTWELYIPSNLAYGEEGAPPVIGSNQTLIFKVKLIDIKKG